MEEAVFSFKDVLYILGFLATFAGSFFTIKIVTAKHSIEIKNLKERLPETNATVGTINSDLKDVKKLLSEIKGFLQIKD